MKALWVLLGLAVFTYAAICGAFLIGQRAFIYFPVTTRDASVPAITLQRDGVPVRVSTYAAPTPRAVIYFGGNAEDVSQAIPGLRDAFPGAAIHALHYRGYGGYGGSGGSPSESALVGDAAALVAHVRRRYPDIVLVGRSLGSGVAVQVARRHPPTRLVLVTPFDSLAAVAGRHYPWLPVQLILRDRFDSAARAPHITAPTTIVVAANDRIVPPHHAHALARRFAPGVARIVVLDGAGHNDIDAHPAYVAALAGDAASPRGLSPPAPSG